MPKLAQKKPILWAQNFSGFAILMEATSPQFLQKVYITGEPDENLLIGIT